jgi:hypothetical protein
MPFRFFFVAPEAGFNAKINSREKGLVRFQENTKWDNSPL